MQHILRIDASGRHEQSVTRALGDELVARLQAEYEGAELSVRDLSQGVPFVDQQWIEANNTAQEQRDDEQQAALAGSDSLVAELLKADAVVITVPIYNFSIPAVLKAWIDQICRARLTFRYTENGPQGMLGDKPVYLVMASGGVPLGSPMDFASPYLRHVLAFIGIQDVHIVAAEQVNSDQPAALANAQRQIEQLLPQQLIV